MEKDKVLDIIYMIPLALILGITPLLVRYKKIPLGEVVASYWVRDYNADFFSYYKMNWFLLCILLGFIVFYIYIRRQGKLKKTAYYIPVGVYIVMIIVSTVFSECKKTSMIGFPDRYEGMPVLLGYMLLVILAINLIKNRRQIKFLLSILLISALIIGLVGFYQFFGFDLFQTDIGYRLLLPDSAYEELVNKLDFRFENRNIIYSTFYNPNYVGSYFIMLFMLTLVMYLFAEKRQERMVYGALNLLMFANWLGSFSRAGILGGIFSLLVTGLILRRVILARWRSLLVLLVCFALVFTFMDYYSGGKLSREFLSLGEETKLALEGGTADVKDVRSENGKVIFLTEEHELQIQFDKSGNLQLEDGEGKRLPLYSSRNDNYIYVRDKRYLDFKFLLKENKDNSRILELYYGKKNINFVANFVLDQIWVIGIKGNVYSVQEVEGWGFEGREKLASKRGYIWSRSLPLLEKTLLRGFGPDTYAIYFPQEDVIGKFKFLGNPNKVVDKPHSMYLQMGINTGVIALIGIVILFAMYFIRNVALYWTSGFRNWFSRAGIAIFAAVNGYIVAGIFNDSTISVAPVFWFLLGLGIMVELKLKRDHIYERW